MFEFETDDGKVKCSVSFDTALLYESEFQGDIIADIFGVQSLDSAEVVFENGELMGVDFTKVGWPKVMRALWAAAKTEDKGTPRFDKWMQSIRGVNLWDARNMLIDELTDCFFRAEAPEEDSEEQS